MCVQVGINVYIHHIKYHVKPHSSRWFSVACVPAIVHRNYFFHLYKKDISPASKVKFRQASNCCKRSLESSRLAYTNKTNESITYQKLGSCDIWQIANTVLNKGKSAIPSLFNSPEVPSAPGEQNCIISKELSSPPPPSIKC